jgi:hypothetical protein
MSSTFTRPPEDTNGSAAVFSDDRWELVQRLSSGSTFQKAFRLRKFFLHVAQCALEKKPEAATEQQIGIHVFGRSPGYNPNDDNIVRSQARLLRLKLEHYFANEGKDDPYVISIPKGQYLPVFEPRAPAGAPLPYAPPSAAEPNRRALIHTLAAISVTFACTTFLTGGLWLRAREVAYPRQPPSFAAFWNSVLPAGSPALIVTSDDTYGLLQEATRRDIPLSAYVARTYSQDAGLMARNSGLEGLFGKFNDAHLSEFYDVVGTLRLQQVDQFRRAHVSVRFARDCNLRDINSGNVVLIGSRHSNPWAELFEHDLNFTYSYDYGSMQNYCRNRSPRPGEAVRYPTERDARDRVTYGTVALVSGASGSKVLMIAGTSIAGAEMAADFITDPRACARFLAALPQNASNGAGFQVLLRGMSLSGQQASAPVVVGWRSGEGRSALHR